MIMIILLLGMHKGEQNQVFLWPTSIMKSKISIIDCLYGLKDILVTGIIKFSFTKQHKRVDF